jgi:hypothetical protein
MRLLGYEVVTSPPHNLTASPLYNLTIMKRHFSFLLFLCCSLSAVAQDTCRFSSSIYLTAHPKADVTMPFSVVAEGKRFAPVWGLDLAWISEQNLMKGVNHIGKADIGIGRSAFRFTEPLTDDSVLASSVVKVLKQRSQLFDKLDPQLPIVFTADQEAGTNEYFVKNRSANVDHWAAMINSHVHWMQANTRHPIAGISPFNEGDLWTEEEGSTVAKQWQVAKILKEQYPRCADIAMVGGNTLNNDKALDWYTSGKQYYDWGNTHQLAGSFDNFVKFYQQVATDGKVGYGDEMHNVGEAMIGLEYGMTVGIWWGFDSRARGEFCQISRHGERLAYGEHRNNWTSASVYRHDDGRVKAFIGSSERQAVTTTFEFVSTEHEVYYDGYGPVHNFMIEMPGGNGYQKGQTNAERVVDITWGEDVAPGVLNGTYKIVNKMSGNVVSYSINGSNIVQQKNNASNKKQQWTVKPCSSRVGGDYSFFDIESVDNPNIRMNVKNYSTVMEDLIAWTQDGPTSNEQWYVEYAGNGYYYIRNRESALYMSSAGTSATARVNQNTLLPESSRDRQLWRFLPVDVTYETQAPAAPASLTAEAREASVSLTWNAVPDDDVEGYMVLRAPQATGEWNTIARKLQQTSFTDNTCRPGTLYIYKVKAIDRAQNLSLPSDSVVSGPTAQPAMVARWHFDGNTLDDTPNMMDAAFCGTPTYPALHQSGTQSLSFVRASGNYVQLPCQIASTSELTVAMWVYLRSGDTWQRLFDFGNDTDHYMFLTPNNSYTNVMRFAIKNGGDEQTVDCNAKIGTFRWVHVAVAIGHDKTTIYVNGEEAGFSTGITIRPSDISPVLNYLGRSQFAADPFLHAYLDDVRVYNYAVTAEEVGAMMTDVEPSAVAPLSVAPSSRVPVHGLDGIRRSGLRRGINIVGGKKVAK